MFMLLGRQITKQHKNAIFILSVFWSACAVAGNQFFDGSFFNSGATAASSWWRAGSSLDLDFGNDRYYLSGTSYTGISNFITAAGATFSRGSIATYYDKTGTVKTAAANVPRLTYDPTNLNSKGILIEESSTNILTSSADFTSGGWSHTTSITVTAGAAAAPDGTVTANLISANGSTNSFINVSGLPSLASSTYTRSVFFKAGTTSMVYFEFTDTTNCANYCVANFNLSNGTTSWASVHPGQGAINMTALPNGWYRCEASFTYSATPGNNFVTYIGAYGSGTGTVYGWGGQFENKAFATSYIPTTTSAVTRSADSFAIPVGTWFTSSAGTFISSSYGQLNSNQNGYSRIVGGDLPKAFIGFDSNGSAKISTWNGSVASSVVGSGYNYPSTTLTNPVRAAVAWDQVSGARSLASTSGKLVADVYGSGDYTTTNIYPGGSSYDPLNAPVQRMTFFASKLSDTALKNYVP